MKRISISLLVLLLSHAGLSQEIQDLGINSKTGLKEIRIVLPELPDGAKPLDMVLIPAGSFLMGSSRDGATRTIHAWPAHEVKISKPFYIAKYEHTQGQWDALGLRNRAKFKDNPDRPMEKVSWFEVQSYYHKLCHQSVGYFRLPTEAEWEYACRAGTTTSYSFGDSLCKADEYLWWNENCPDGKPQEAGLKLPNAWGLYDMQGNVSEWCQDVWQKPEVREAQTDPRCTSTFSWFLSNMVFRGGSFLDRREEFLQSAARRYEQAVDYHFSLGFRLVREMDEEE